MNKDFDKVKDILSNLKEDYVNSCTAEIIDPAAPITERDIVSEIYCRFKNCFHDTDLYPHTEIKPVAFKNIAPKELAILPRIDVVILKDLASRTWISSAIKIQNQYKKGSIESRYSSIPVEFFHTAIEVKIQSNVRDAQKDINTLVQIYEQNKRCNCFMVLLNARGRTKDHLQIKQNAEQKSICLIEYTCK